MGKKGREEERKGREGRRREQVEKWDGGEGNQVSGNFIQTPTYHPPT